MSDHLTVSRQRKRTINLFRTTWSFSLNSFVFFSTLEVSNSFWYSAEVSHKTVLLVEYEAHHSIMSPFAYVVDQVPEYD